MIGDSVLEAGIQYNLVCPQVPCLTSNCRSGGQVYQPGVDVPDTSNTQTTRHLGLGTQSHSKYQLENLN